MSIRSATNADIVLWSAVSPLAPIYYKKSLRSQLIKLGATASAFGFGIEFDGSITLHCYTPSSGCPYPDEPALAVLTMEDGSKIQVHLQTKYYEPRNIKSLPEPWCYDEFEQTP